MSQIILAEESAPLESETLNATIQIYESAAPITSPQMTSIDDLLNAEEEISDQPLETVWLKEEPSYLNIFTKNVLQVDAHYLKGDTILSNGYYRCIGDSCPACKAELQKQAFVLLPVVDFYDATVKILRIPRQKGPGKLLTEIGKVTSLPDPSSVMTKITKGSNNKYSVDVKERQSDGDIAAAVKRFQKQIEAGMVEIGSVVPELSRADMASHAEVAKKLKLEGIEL